MEQPKEEGVKQCLADVGRAMIEGALDPVGIVVNGAASVAVGAAYDVRQYNRSAGGMMGKTKLVPPGGSVSRFSIARAGGVLAGKLFLVGTAIVAVGNAAVAAYKSKSCGLQ